MADLLHITTPVTPKDYQLPNNRHSNQQTEFSNGQIFNLGDQTKIVKTNDRTDDFAEQNLKDSSLNMPKSMTSMGSISGTVDTVKELLGKATLSALAAKGDHDTLNKITEFAQEIILSPDELLKDMVDQQDTATIFSGKLWDTLRGLLKTGSDDLNSAITDFAKAAADNAAKNEILDSLSANLKYLSKELAPSKAVADELMKASEALTGPDAARNFNAIKSTLVQLVNYTGQSLLLDNKSQNLLPLLIYNMSRYNNDPEALKESFGTLLNIYDNMNLSAADLKMLAAASGADADQASIKAQLEKLFDDFILGTDLPQDVKNSSILNKSVLEEQNKLDSMTNLLSLGVKKMAERLDADRLKTTLGGIDMSKGSQSVKLALASVTPNTGAMSDALDSIIGHFDRTGDLQGLIDRLSDILNSIDDMDKKLPLAQVLNEGLENMAKTEGINYRPPTSMENLADFLVKNIDDKTLQSLTAANRSDMVQNMLTSPGVFNPLIHIFAPLDAFGMRAFAEIWADRNSERLIGGKGKDGEDGDTSHIFMCFDMENVGYFELELYAKNTNLSVMLLCPEGLEQKFSSLKTAVPRIAAASGYTVGTTIVDTLYQKRNLSTVFPKLNESRGNFNVKI